MNEERKLKDELRKMMEDIKERRKEVSGASYNFGLVVMDWWVNEWKDEGRKERWRD